MSYLCGGIHNKFMGHYPQKGRASRVQVGLRNLGLAGLAFLSGFIRILDANMTQAAPLANRVYCLGLRIHGSRFCLGARWMRA